jgi:predicted transcriptional regulator
MIRPLALALVVVLLVGLFAPATVAATDVSTADGMISTPDRVEMPAFDRLRPIAVSSGLSRVDGDGILEQPTRAAVYEAIEETPGRTLREIAATIGITKSTARYHVDVLRNAGFVVASEASGALRFAPASADAELTAALQADATSRILDAVAAHEPASVTTVAEATDRSPSTASYHLSALEDRGLVERERTGEAVVTTLSPAIRGEIFDKTTTGDD